MYPSVLSFPETSSRQLSASYADILGLPFASDWFLPFLAEDHRFCVSLHEACVRVLCGIWLISQVFHGQSLALCSLISECLPSEPWW